MIFRTINSKIEKPSYTINIQNMDIAQGHWGAEKYMVQFLDEIETMSYDKENFEKNLIKHCLTISRYNLRTEGMTFYNTNNGLVLLVISDRRNFDHSIPWIDRRMEIDLKKQGIKFTVVEMLKSEQKNLREGGEARLPANWVVNEEMNNRLELFKKFV